MSETRPFHVAIIGMGGFAASHHDAIASLEAEGACRLVATCDPCMNAFADRCAALRFGERGVRLFDDYLAMLDATGGDLDFVAIPTPVPLHAPMHRTCVERGLAAYLEKPPTLVWDELQEMLAVEKNARRATQVGFNFIADPLRHAIKRRIAAGEFGRVLRASAFGLWAREGVAYYRRAEWAGRLMLGGRLVLDSPIGNALAHLVHNTLFWCGSEAMAWGEVEAVEAELYRAHRIEGADTFFVRARAGNGVEVRLGMTHACDGPPTQGEIVECERAIIDFQPYARTGDGRDYQHATIRHADGREEDLRETALGHLQDFLRAHFRAYGDYVAGRAERPLTRLEDCRPFVALNDLAYIAAGRIATVAEEHIARTQKDAAAPVAGAGPSGYAAIAGIGEAVREFVASGRLPSEQRAPWAAAGGRATMAGLPMLRRVVEAMVLEQASQ